MQACLQEFNKEVADKASIARNGEELLSQSYESMTKLSLNSLRYHILLKKVATATTVVTSEALLATSNAAMFHSYQTYHQTQVWRGEGIGPLGSNFFIQKRRMMPVTMMVLPRPPHLHKIVCCSCKTGWKTMTCSCHKHGLKCTDSCKECCGISCINCQEVDLDVFDEHD